MKSHGIPWWNPPKNHQTHCKTLSCLVHNGRWFRPLHQRGDLEKNERPLGKTKNKYNGGYDRDICICICIYIYIHMCMYKIWDAFPKKQFIQGYMNCFLEMRPRSYTYTCVYIYIHICNPPLITRNHCVFEHTLISTIDCKVTPHTDARPDVWTCPCEAKRLEDVMTVGCDSQEHWSLSNIVAKEVCWKKCVWQHPWKNSVAAEDRWLTFGKADSTV